jgi:hypothetical protein
MNDREFRNDRELGCHDGYNFQPLMSQSEGYYEGVSMKESEGYTARIARDGQAYLFP